MAERNGEKKWRKKATKKTQEKYTLILNAMKPDIWYKASQFENVVDLKESRIKELLRDMVEQDLIESSGITKGKQYRKSSAKRL